MAIGTIYKEQKELLEALYEKKGVDVFVASYGSLENKEDGRIQSMSTWSQGVPTLLPETDLIGLVETDAKGEISKNSRVIITDGCYARELVGDLMQPTDLYPRRYRVDQFPTKEQLQLLETRSRG